MEQRAGGIKAGKCEERGGFLDRKIGSWEGGKIKKWEDGRLRSYEDKALQGA